MIRLFDRDETDFNHNETILNDVISAEPEVLANGMYELVLEYPRNEFAKQLTEGKVIKAPTADGEQLFRIYKPVKSLNTYTIYARHIFYDLLTNFIEDIRPTKKTGSGALQDILNAAQIDQGFTSVSDIENIGTAYYIRKSPVEALLGASNSFINVWGGELVRDNHTIKMLANAGQDRGYDVTIGKNLQGIEVTTDESNVFTRIYPTVVMDEQNVTTLPEKYVDSPLIDNYEYPRIAEERIDLTEEEKELPLSEIYKLMRDHVKGLFKQGIDKPEVNFKIDFIELSQTEQYKYLKILEQLDLYDMVSVYVPELDVDIKAKVIRTKYDSLRKRYINMELGSFKANGGTQAKNTINRVDKKVDEASSHLKQAFDKAQDMITGNLGGHLITRLNAEGKPYELLVMDTEDIQTAKNVIRLNQQGIGFSSNGYNGPFGVAITIDGVLNAEVINVLNLNASSITAGILMDRNGKFSLNMDTGKAIMKDGEFQGYVDAETGNIAGFTLDGGVLHAQLASGRHTTIKGTGDVAFATDSPNPYSTTDASLQIWHDGKIRFGGQGQRIYNDGNRLMLEASAANELYLNATNLRANGHFTPDQSTQSWDWALGRSGMADRWLRVYVKNSESVESDSRLKRQIQDLPDGLIEELKEVEPKMYEKGGKLHFGYIAQDVERALFKYAVKEVGFENAREYADSFDILDRGESYLALVYSEIAVLKDEEQNRRIKELEKRLEKLENANNERTVCK